VQRQRRITAGVLIGALLLVLVVVIAPGGGTGDANLLGSKSDKPKKPPPPPQLPRGGRIIIPNNRVVAFYGAPQDDELGTLGIGKPAQVARRLERQARPYRAGGKPVLPAFELIAVVASGAPGADGMYRYRQPRRVIDRYLAAARKAKALLLLDIQPGRADFMDEVRRLRPYLEQPDVSLALDPEWKIAPGQVPGKVIGTTSAADVNRVSAYLAAIGRQRNLPQKMLLIHQFTDDMITNKPALVDRRGVKLILNVDGFGNQPAKISKYVGFTRSGRRFRHGFKLFYKEDTNLMSPRQVLRLRPPPDIVEYE
jgi:hypothetical protein